MAPMMSGLILLRIIGVFAIVFGVILVVCAFRARKLGKSFKG